jgi:hypothetical protein
VSIFLKTVSQIRSSHTCTNDSQFHDIFEIKIAYISC